MKNEFFLFSSFMFPMIVQNVLLVNSTVSYGSITNSKISYVEHLVNCQLYKFRDTPKPKYRAFRNFEQVENGVNGCRRRFLGVSGIFKFDSPWYDT
jgi:hypothetical protein